jgi:UV DNA damage endonuclease
MRVPFFRVPSAIIRVPRLSTMPRKRALANGAVENAPPPKPTSPTSRPSPSPMHKASRSVSGTKRKASPSTESPPLNRNISSAVLEAAEAREASPDEGDSQNPDLDSSDQATQARQPAVNSEILPLPWKGRLGYACLNTILRDLKPPIFCSRTCRMDTILGTAEKEGKGLDFAKDLGRQNAADLSRISHCPLKCG